VSAPEPVQAAWDDAVAHWDDPAKHKALLGLVAQHSCFAWAAARYKERAGDPIADKQMERLRTSAMATMMATGAAKKQDEPSPFRATIIMLIALLVAMIVGLLIVKTIHDHGAH
jgi:flagellar biosynthesis/type III secretory pathway M-ring protein FliF/YscJ